MKTITQLSNRGTRFNEQRHIIVTMMVFIHFLKNYSNDYVDVVISIVFITLNFN